VAGADATPARAAAPRDAAPSGAVGVHVKLDTGMGRLGTRDPAEADRTADAVTTAPGLRLAGAMTHFATADEADRSFLAQQLAAFEPWAHGIAERHPGVLTHAANSAAALAEPAARFDLVRCGIAVYGMDPFHRDPAAHGLEPALELRSYVAEVKRCRPGESAGYGRRFVADRETWLGTIPIGYGDGVRRALTNNADLLVSGRRVPLVGTVSMDNITVDLGPEEPADRGAEAILIGPGLLAEEMAGRLGTINYEVTCGITVRVPREYHRDGAPVGPRAEAAPVEAPAGAAP
jgi:alanine racemase